MYCERDRNILKGSNSICYAYDIVKTPDKNNQFIMESKCIYKKHCKVIQLVSNKYNIDIFEWNVIASVKCNLI